jgi:hypothetical protein
MRDRVDRPKLPLDFGESARQLLPSGLMCRASELPGELGNCQAQRFSTPQLFGISFGLRHGAARALFFTLVHPFLNAVLRVDKSFACVAHSHLLFINCAGAPTRRATLDAFSIAIAGYQ